MGSCWPNSTGRGTSPQYRILLCTPKGKTFMLNHHYMDLIDLFLNKSKKGFFNSTFLIPRLIETYPQENIRFCVG
jgi:hypothetical protein